MSKILFLYSELSGYFQACANELSNHVDEVHIVRWPVNAEAPFQLTFATNVIIHERNDYNHNTLLHLAKSIAPQLIVASGWMDKGYLKVCKHFYKHIPTIMSMDNHWFGTVKQHLACLLAPITLHCAFSHIWIPGQPQELYAQKLGFKKNQILYGFYSANVNAFLPRFNLLESIPDFVYPKRFIYIGRYVEQKGLNSLFDAFIEMQNETPSDWELWCIGTGSLWDKRPIHPKIKHIGFLQPSEIAPYLMQTGIFVLPSFYEPWGVVVHEMAAAGFPLICSRSVGAATKFLNEGVNGWYFKTSDKDDLKRVLHIAVNTSNDELHQMSKYSNTLALNWTPQQWSQLLMTIIHSNEK